MTISSTKRELLEENVLSKKLSIESQIGKQHNQEQTVAIAATFTVEPIEESIAYWMKKLNISSTINFAPYNQVFQQLLDPTSLLSRNTQGINTILLRFEDWYRFETNTEQDETVEANISQFVYKLAEALQIAAKRSSVPYLVCICPPSPLATTNVERQSFFAQLEEKLKEYLVETGSIYVAKSAEVIDLYPVSSFYDPYGDGAGHIPFTPLFFAALGTFIARKMYSLLHTPYKVLALDCDQTLWQGICGEDGVDGLVIDPIRRKFQEFLLAQQKAGMLLCLCSKNNEQDVFEVFARHPEMPLQREHLVSWRVNWHPKSQNLRSLADELQLSLESFIFIDDSLLECAEVQMHCPEVLTVPLPSNLDDFPLQLQHVWAFDHLKVTTEDKKRTQLYQQQIQRHTLQKDSLTLEDFLANLDLHIQINQLQDTQLSRVAQLTQRTNQFNCTTIRRTESEIQQFCLVEQKGECLTVEVSDRFGNYGLVGTLLFKTHAQELEVDTFLLSCRVLGRGVEYQLLAKLGEIAQKRGIDYVYVPFVPTTKNAPAREFLERAEAVVERASRNEEGFLFPSAMLVGLTYTPSAGLDEVTYEAERRQDNNVAVPQNMSISTEPSTKNLLLLEIATKLNSAGLVLQEITTQRYECLDRQEPIILPRTMVEKQISEIWSEVLKLNQVGIRDNFFDLGGNSLLAVTMSSRLYATFGKKLALSTFLAVPTIEQLAHVLESQEEVSSSFVAVQASGSKTPFFYLHGAYRGDGFYCFPLSRYLGVEQPFYALTPHQFDDVQVPPTLEEIATKHVQTIREMQPEGPYQLGGFCNGALVAYEMAQQLKAAGQTVDTLVLIDPTFLGYRRSIRQTITVLGMFLRWSQERQVNEFLWSRYIVSYLRHVYRYLQVPLYRELEMEVDLKEEGSILKWGALYELKQSREAEMKLLGEQQKLPQRGNVFHKLLSRLTALFPDTLRPEKQVLRQDWEGLFFWLTAYYQPSCYTDKCGLLFSATTSKPLLRRWLSVVRTKTQTTGFHTIKGTHHTCKTDYVQDLAMCVQMYLDQE